MPLNATMNQEAAPGGSLADERTRRQGRKGAASWTGPAATGNEHGKS